MSNLAIQQYKKQSVQSMTQGQQLVMLFDEAIKNLNYATCMLNDHNFQAFEKCTQKCKDIFNYLSNALDRQYPLSHNLYQMYLFFNQEIIRSEIKRDAEGIKQIIPIVRDLRDTWVEADKLTHREKASSGQL